MELQIDPIKYTDDQITGSKGKGICLVATLLNEEKFLDEWLVYHKMLGISHFYLYDDDPSLPLEKHLQPHCNYVTVIPWKGKEKNNPDCNNQVMAYRHAWKNYLHNYEWVVFLDADEFVVLREHNNINDFLAEFDQSAVALNWHVFGHNGYYDDPEDLVTTSLTRRRLIPVNNIKTFTRTKAIREINTMHLCELTNGIIVDANKKPFKKQYYPGKTNVAHVNHYQTRSFKNWMKRAERGVVHFIAGDCPPEQAWRTTEESVLKQFVTTVTLDKNEHIDEYMFRYSFDIRKGIFLLNRNQGILAEVDTESGKNMKHDIENTLIQISKIILPEALKIADIDLFNNKHSLALYLFNYGRFACNPEFEQLALKLIENLFEKTDAETHDIAALGAAVECMAQSCFVNIDTDEILEDIDTLLQYKVFSKSINDMNNLYQGAAGVGRYFLYRLHNSFISCRSEIQDNTMLAITNIIDLLDAEYENTFEFYRVIEFISSSYSFLEGSAKIRAKTYCDNALKNLIVNSKSGWNINELSPLNATVILLNAAKKMNDTTYADYANLLIKKHQLEHEQQEHMTVINNALLWLNYYRLYQIDSAEHHKNKALRWLQKTISTINNRLSNNKLLEAGDITTYAHISLLLQYAVDNRVACSINLFY